DQKSQSVCLNNIGSVLHEKGQYKQAIEFSMKALALAKNAGARYELMNIYKSLSQSCEKNKDYTNAFGYLSNYISLHDTLYNEENSRKLAQTEMQYEFDKKQQQRIFEEKQREIARQAELKRQRIFLYSALGGLVLMLLLAFYMYRSYQIKKKANKILAAQKAEIEDKNRQIMDSIRYARKIQNAILPSDAFIDSVLEDNFVLFRPKEMVSGDFYWVEKKDNKILFASVDCTGHGVPGALMSIVGHNILSQAINEKKLTDAGSILNHLSSELISTLGYSGSGDDDVDIRDSMDLALCSLNRDKMVMQFVGVHNPMYIIRNNEVLQFKPHSHPIGAAFTEDFKEYIHEEVPIEIGDLVYLFSDGYVDQVGGPERKKFLSKRFRQTLLEIHHLTMAEQKQKLSEIFENWKGKGEQYDDVLVVGVRI
ncbi:MAG: SpoIIE family protein phosphatase, partial [Bacteroidota bacterium]